MSTSIRFPKMSITGDIGSGKSAVSRILQRETGFPLYSTGGLQRQIATRHGMTTLELNQYTETHPEIDDEIDGESIRLGKTEESFILDSRIAWHFIPHSFKVYLSVNLDEAARRILGDRDRTGESYEDLETAKTDIRKRRQSEVERFRRIYKIDLSDLSNYDLIVDTSREPPGIIAEKVLNSFRQWANKPSRMNAGTSTLRSNA